MKCSPSLRTTTANSRSDQLLIIEGNRHTSGDLNIDTT